MALGSAKIRRWKEWEKETLSVDYEFSNGWQEMFWMMLLSPVIILAVGTKLQAIITKMANEIQERHAVVQGIPLVHLGDDHFWFRRHQIAEGLRDNLLTCIVRAWDYDAPLYVAPTMNTFMWNNPSTKLQLETIDKLGISLIPPITKRLVCGDFGNGTMAEPI